MKKEEIRTYIIIAILLVAITAIIGGAIYYIIK